MEVSLKYPLLDKLNQHEYIGGWEEGNDVFLWYRDESGQRKAIGAYNIPKYYCLTVADFKRLPKDILAAWKEDGYYTKGEIHGEYAYFYNTNVRLRRNDFEKFLTDTENVYGIKWLEADITRLNRLMIDNDLRVAAPEKLRVAYFDIETDDRGEKIQVGVDRIISIAWKERETGAEYFLRLESDTDGAEELFLKEIITRLTEYDLLIGYNNYGFDDECLAGRFSHYGIDTTKWRRIPTLDMFNLLERQGTFRKMGVVNKKLDTIARKVVGRGKVAHEEGTFEMWAEKPELLELYNYEDVRLIYEMDKILGTTGLVMSVCTTAGLLHSIGYSPAKTVDNFILRKAARNRDSGKFDYRYPTQYYRPEHKLGSKNAYSRNALSSDKRKGRKDELAEMGIDYEPVTGAMVLPVTPGIYRNVYFCDFKSLYPNTIRCFNIGLDTLVDGDSPLPKCKAPDGEYWYRTDVTSGMAESIETLLKMRADIRAQMKSVTDDVKRKGMDIQQNGVKELTNSIYGVTAQYGARYYHRGVAESITGGGRLFLPFGQEIVERLGHKVALGDTDSLAISIQGNGVDVDGLKDEYIQQLRQMLKEKYNAYRPEVLDMAVERKADALLIVARKLYGLLVTMKDGKECAPELLVKGLGIIKGNIPQWCSEVSKVILVDMLTGNRDADYFIQKLTGLRQMLVDGIIPIQKLLISARLGKPTDDYIGENPLVHVRVARRMQEAGKLVRAYDTITYLVTEGNGAHIEAAGEGEIKAGETKYDAAYLWNTFIMQQAGKYLEIAYPEVEWDELFRFPKNTKKHPFELKLVVKSEQL